MKFRIWTILWVFALLASAMATFSQEPLVGIIVASYVLYLWSIILDWTKSRGMTLVELLIVLLISLTFFTFLFPAVMRSLEGERVSQCRAAISQVSKSLLQYRDQNGVLPPDVVRDSSGKAMHSWRTLILPFLGQKNLFNQYDLTKLWDDAVNIATTKTSLPIYSCRNDITSIRNDMTSYFAVVGPGTAWEAMRSNKKPFTDKPSRTILLIEQLDKGVSWSEPKDLTVDEAIKLLTLPKSTPQNLHMSWGESKFFNKPNPKQRAHGFNIAFADGSARFVSVPISKKLAKALLTASGGEEISDEEFQQFWAPSVNYTRIYSFTVFVLFSLFPVVKLWRKDDPAIKPTS